MPETGVFSGGGRWGREGQFWGLLIGGLQPGHRAGKKAEGPSPRALHRNSVPYLLESHVNLRWPQPLVTPMGVLAQELSWGVLKPP